MIKQLFKWRKIILIGAIPYLFFMFIFTYRIDYEMTAPGGLTTVTDQVTFDQQYEDMGSFYTIYVMAIDRPTFFMFGLGYFDESIEVNELPTYRQGISDSVNFRSGQLAKDNAWNAAIISAFEALDLDTSFEIEQKITLIYDYISHDEIDLGDTVLAVNDNPDIYDAISQTACNEEAVFTVRTKSGEVKDYPILKQMVDGNCVFGLSIREYYNLTDTEIDYTIDDSYIGGPSGGFMQFLHIYNVLTESDLTQGLKIAGTGQIYINGDIGPIGGVTQKVYTAHYNDVDILFVPRLNDDNYHDNYQEALRAMEALDTDMELVGVENWLDAVNYLLALRGDELV
ncbi:MAG: S16 family serine protease [Candidatus Izemoplasmataceae bacterium]